MDQFTLNLIVIGLSFALYFGIAFWARAGSTAEFYAAGQGVGPVVNGMATAADWMSAASFISMAGLIAFGGYNNSVFLMGWTGGYVLLALLLAPYLRKFGKFTVPEFVGDRFYSTSARMVAVICLLVISITYVIGQMVGVGVTFARFLEVSTTTGLLIGSAVVFAYAVFGGMKGITYTQVAQYVVLICAYTVPALFISLSLTGNVIPQLGLIGGYAPSGGDVYFLDKLDQVVTDLGFAAYTADTSNMLNMFLVTMSLMIGTAGLPHVIIRFFTVAKVSDARISAGWALVFIALLYTVAPAVGSMARLNITTTFWPGAVQGETFSAPALSIAEIDSNPDLAWIRNWEKTGLLAFSDKNGDGLIQYFNEPAPLVAANKAVTDANAALAAAAADADKAPLEAAVAAAITARDAVLAETNLGGQSLAAQGIVGNELTTVNNDIMVLANPEIAALPGWVIALVAAGGLAAALSTAAGLLLAISSAISHDLIKGALKPDISEKGELLAARISMAFAIVLATWLGLDPPGFAAQVVALAFGLAAATIFPVLMMGIFSTVVTKEGAIVGMIVGLVSTAVYIFIYLGWFFIPGTNMLPNTPDAHWMGISPAAFGPIGAILNFASAYLVSMMTKAPPQDVQDLIQSIRVPKGAGKAHAH
ncbi:sodium:solute symporter family protein [Pseudorhodobacter sp. MZDSW-24AT]|uniref:sodium:solute symporter family protein n=1 Tax=Pseudorhodobacter sp. MZDSW-24AT TaxID=2052957 RepID=UPI000C1E6435|nr:sodium:solute symporter family protein [Pseudorhodobacter sp. MZDSW-24AT]PJF07898.1 cation acetate symporter [Pseudorhodobacter sp. MZDSW-24AT]